MGVPFGGEQRVSGRIVAAEGPGLVRHPGEGIKGAPVGVAVLHELVVEGDAQAVAIGKFQVETHLQFAVAGNLQVRIGGVVDPRRGHDRPIGGIRGLGGVDVHLVVIGRGRIQVGGGRRLGGNAVSGPQGPHVRDQVEGSVHARTQGRKAVYDIEPDTGRQVEGTLPNVAAEGVLGKEAELVHKRNIVQRPLAVARLGVGAVGRAVFREDQALAQVPVRFEVGAHQDFFTGVAPLLEQVQVGLGEGVELLSIEIVMREVGIRRHDGIGAGSSGCGDFRAAHVVEFAAHDIGHRGAVRHVGGVDGNGVDVVLLVVGLLVGKAVRQVVPQGLEPALVEGPGSVGVDAPSQVGAARGQVGELVVGVVVAGVLAQAQVQGRGGVQFAESLGPQSLQVEPLVIGIGFGGLRIGVGVVTAQVQVTGFFAQPDTLGSGYLIDFRIALEPHGQRFRAGFRVDDDRPGGQVAILHGRDAADHLHGFDVIGR